MKIPSMYRIRQQLPVQEPINHADKIREELISKKLHSKIKPGMRIAVTAGSRGISHINEVLVTILEEVKSLGGDPFIVPAMGSHGGASREGQVKVLESLGITTESMGVAIHSSMEVKEIGVLDNDAPVYMDQNAYEADGVIVVNRVKAHTAFKDEIESGLTKMLAIGLGKQKGAETIHRLGSEGYHKYLRCAARLILEKSPILLGVALVEDGYKNIVEIKALEPHEIEEEDKRLLKQSKSLMARIPFKEIDVLIIEEIGKDISGSGMDTNVIGKFSLPGEFEPLAPNVNIIVVLDLSEKTHGNAYGIGLSDITTERLYHKIDFHSTFMNCLTSNQVQLGKIPPFLPNDRDAIAQGIRISGHLNSEKTRIVRIRNTLKLQEFWASKPLVEEIKTNMALQSKLSVIEGPEEMMFDTLGFIVR
jgi:hypothetical protein